MLELSKFILMLLITLIIIYVCQLMIKEPFKNISYQYNNINYNSSEQNCDKLNKCNLDKCTYKLVRPKIKNICNKNTTLDLYSQTEIKSMNSLED